MIEIHKENEGKMSQKVSGKKKKDYSCCQVGKLWLTIPRIQGTWKVLLHERKRGMKQEELRE